MLTDHGTEIDGLITDVSMPGMSGIELVKSMRARGFRLPVLLMSGHTLNEHVQEILDLGVRNFVSKPYSIGALAKAIAELIQ